MQFCVWLFLDLLGVCRMVRTHKQFCKEGAQPALFQISYLCCYVVICVVLCIVRVEMCTVLLPPGDNPIAVNKYIISSILPGAWMSVSCTCGVSGRGLCVELITRPEESYPVWCAWVWSWRLANEKAQAHWQLLHHGSKVLFTWLVTLCVQAASCLHVQACNFRTFVNVLRYCIKVISVPPESK
jgi:hypothetical protein